MANQNLFSVPIFFICLRESLEALIVVSVLLSFVEQLMTSGRLNVASDTTTTTLVDGNLSTPIHEDAGSADDIARVKRIVRRMRMQIWAGAFSGFIVALSIGAAFIAVFYTKLTDLWAKTEQLWEGVFSLIAAVIIYLMGLAFLKMDRSRVKWRIKLSAAFDDKVNKIGNAEQASKARWWKMSNDPETKRAREGKWALFLLPFITVVREGLECVVFVGGVSLGEPAVSIPIAVIVGLIAGALIGYVIYRTGSSMALHWFLVASTFILFLIGAGLFSKSVGFFEYYRFSSAVGGDVAESGNGPGSFQVAGNVWHLTYGNPEIGAIGTNGGWQIFNAILGWNNSASLGTILSYVFYWIAVIVALVYGKWSEGRVSFFGFRSEAHQRLTTAKEKRMMERKASPSASAESETEKLAGSPSEHIVEKHQGSQVRDGTLDEEMYPVLLDDKN